MRLSCCSFNHIQFHALPLVQYWSLMAPSTQPMMS